MISQYDGNNVQVPNINPQRHKSAQERLNDRVADYNASKRRRSATPPTSPSPYTSQYYKKARHDSSPSQARSSFRRSHASSPSRGRTSHTGSGNIINIDSDDDDNTVEDKKMTRGSKGRTAILRKKELNAETQEAIEGAYLIFKMDTSVTGMYADRADLEAAALDAYNKARDKLPRKKRMLASQTTGKIARVVRHSSFCRSYRLTYVHTIRSWTRLLLSVLEC